jgi:hypothetical protein
LSLIGALLDSMVLTGRSATSHGRILGANEVKPSPVDGIGTSVLAYKRKKIAWTIRNQIQ